MAWHNDRYLYQFTIYYHPIDFPQHVVLRPVRIGPGTVEHHVIGCLYDSIEEARFDVMGFCDMQIPRDPSDEPQIVETWM